MPLPAACLVSSSLPAPLYPRTRWRYNIEIGFIIIIIELVSVIVL